MHLLLNENVPLATIRRLRREGIDLVSVVEEMAGATDEAVLARARAEDRVIVTFDRDYGELLFGRRLPRPRGVIYLRFDPAFPEEPAEYLLRLIRQEGLIFENLFTVADRTQIRQRQLS